MNLRIGKRGEAIVLNPGVFGEVCCGCNLCIGGLLLTQNISVLFGGCYYVEPLCIGGAASVLNLVYWWGCYSVNPCVLAAVDINLVYWWGRLCVEPCVLVGLLLS